MSATKLPGGRHCRNRATLGHGLYLVSLKWVAICEYTSWTCLASNVAIANDVYHVY